MVLSSDPNKSIVTPTSDKHVISYNIQERSSIIGMLHENLLGYHYCMLPRQMSKGRGHEEWWLRPLSTLKVKSRVSKSIT